MFSYHSHKCKITFHAQFKTAQKVKWNCLMLLIVCTVAMLGIRARAYFHPLVIKLYFYATHFYCLWWPTWLWHKQSIPVITVSILANRNIKIHFIISIIWLCFTKVPLDTGTTEHNSTEKLKHTQTLSQTFSNRHLSFFFIVLSSPFYSKLILTLLDTI